MEATEVRNHVTNYLSNKESLEQFEAWLVEVAWDVEKSSALDAIDLVHKIEGLLAKSSTANWPESALRDELEKSVRSTFSLAQL